MGLKTGGQTENVFKQQLEAQSPSQFHSQMTALLSPGRGLRPVFQRLHTGSPPKVGVPNQELGAHGTVTYLMYVASKPSKPLLI